MGAAQRATLPTHPPRHVAAGSPQMPAARPRAPRAAGCPSVQPPPPASSRANQWRPEGPPLAFPAPAAATLRPASVAGRPRSRSRTEFGARPRRAGPGLSAINAGSVPEPTAELQSHFGNRAPDVTGFDAVQGDRVDRQSVIGPIFLSARATVNLRPRSWSQMPHTGRGCSQAACPIRIASIVNVNPGSGFKISVNETRVPTRNLRGPPS